MHCQAAARSTTPGGRCLLPRDVAGRIDDGKAKARPRLLSDNALTALNAHASREPGGQAVRLEKVVDANPLDVLEQVIGQLDGPPPRWRLAQWVWYFQPIWSHEVTRKNSC